VSRRLDTRNVVTDENLAIIVGVVAPVAAVDVIRNTTVVGDRRRATIKAQVRFGTVVAATAMKLLASRKQTFFLMTVLRILQSQNSHSL
jgi:hypothetical protein